MSRRCHLLPISRYASGGLLMDYLTLFPSASRNLPRFSALAEAVLSQADDLIAVVQNMNAAFSVSGAAGAQLDALGVSVGISRPEGMTDADYRQVIAAKLAMFTWDGANDTAQELLTRIFPGSTICDNQDGTVTVHTVSALQAEQELFPLPAGVRAVVN